MRLALINTAGIHISLGHMDNRSNLQHRVHRWLHGRERHEYQQDRHQDFLLADINPLLSLQVFLTNLRYFSPRKIKLRPQNDKKRGISRVLQKIMLKKQLIFNFNYI